MKFTAATFVRLRDKTANRTYGLSLARGLSQPEWQKLGIRQSVLNAFEIEMLERSASKVKASQEAAAFLHSDVVLLKEDKPRRLGD